MASWGGDVLFDEAGAGRRFAPYNEWILDVRACSTRRGSRRTVILTPEHGVRVPSIVAPARSAQIAGVVNLFSYSMTYAPRSAGNREIAFSASSRISSLTSPLAA